MHEREETIFNAALDCSSEIERSQFLNQACGDNLELRASVECLLRDYEAGRFLENQPYDPALASTTLSQHSPGFHSQIGPYKVLEKIGEGGMGIVYMAEQIKPIRRNVALKVIKPGMDTEHVIARFEAERQALALMDHPHIAKVLDAGSTASGHPYFAMELVKGIPITEYCRLHKLTTRERLELVVNVCDAVQHAHQKGIIHRDLKPNNLLVELHDVKASLKVVDFGIAKSIGQRLTDRTLFTRFNQMLGTPLYMSPEQSQLNGLDVDTRSDVYSLGVLLYELLTGTTPFGSQGSDRDSFEELRSRILSEDPPRPSQRISTLKAEALSTLTNSQQIDSRKLKQMVRNELDWVVMKALEKDRTRRYQSASAFAEDIQRYLNDEPVLACPPKTWYRFSKFARRNRVALTTSGLVAVALIIGTGVSVWQAVRASSAERRADALLLEARHAVDEMYTEVAEEWLNQQPKLTEVQRAFLEKALAFYNRFATLEDATPEMRHERAKAFERVGKIQSKFAQNELAIAAYRSCIAEASELVLEFPERTDYRFVLASCRTGLAAALRESSGDDLAKEQILLACGDLKPLIQNHSTLPKDRVRLASLLGLASSQLTRSKCMAEAKELMLGELSIGQSLVAENPDDYKCRFVLADSYSTQGQYFMWWGQQDDEAEPALREAIKRFGVLEAERPADIKTRSHLAGSLWNLGVVLGRTQVDHPELDGLYQRSLSIFEGLVRDFPDEISFRDGLATMHSKLAGITHRNGRHAESEVHYREALGIYEYCVNHSQDVPRFESRIDNMLNGLGGQLISQNKVDEATAVFQRWTTHARLAFDKYPEARGSFFRGQIVKSSHAFASVLLHQNKHAEAARAVDDLLEYYKQPHSQSLHNDVLAMFGTRSCLLNCAEAAKRDTTLSAERIEEAVQKYHVRAKLWIEEAQVVSDKFASQIEEHPNVQGWTVVDLCESLLTQVDEVGDPLYPDQPSGERAASQMLVSSLVRDTVNRFPDDPSLHLIAGFLCTAPEEYRNNELAIQLAEQGIQLDPTNELAIQSKCWALLRDQQWGHCVEATAALKSKSESDFVLAISQWKLGNKTEAVECFRRGQEWLVGYEKRCGEKIKNGQLSFPHPNMLKRLESEAALLLGVEAAVPESVVPEV